MFTSETVLGRFVCRVENQYPLPELARQAWPLLSLNGAGVLIEANFANLATVLESHPTWTESFLRVVQHPKLDGSSIADLSASSLTKTDPQFLTGLLYGFGLPSLLFSELPADAAKKYWQRTLLRSVGIHLLSRTLDLADRAGLFPASMVADMGSLVLLRELKQTYVQFVEDAEKHGQDLYQMELDSLGFDHRVLAVRLLDRWSVADQIARTVGEAAIGNAVVDETSSAAPLSAADHRRYVFLAADLASELMGGRLIGKIAEKNSTRIVRIARHAFGWNLDQLQTWANEIVEPTQHLATSFSVEFGSPQQIDRHLEQAWNADLANERSANKKSEGPNLEGKAIESSSQDRDRSQDKNYSIPVLPEGSGAVPNPYQAIASEPSETNSWVGTVGMGSGGPARPNTAPQSKSEPRSATSVLTDLASSWVSDPHLLGQVQSTIELCRARRQALSLTLAQIDQFESLLFGGSLDEVYQIQQSLMTGFEQMMSGEGGKVVELGDDKFGFLLPGLDRIAANRLGQEVLRVVRHWSSNRQLSGKTGLTLSLGCASTDVPARNFRADSLVEAAARCLEHVQKASGNGLKSIDIYY